MISTMRNSIRKEGLIDIRWSENMCLAVLYLPCFRRDLVSLVLAFFFFFFCVYRAPTHLVYSQRSLFDVAVHHLSLSLMLSRVSRGRASFLR